MGSSFVLLEVKVRMNLEKKLDFTVQNVGTGYSDGHSNSYQYAAREDISAFAESAPHHNMASTLM